MHEQDRPPQHANLHEKKRHQNRRQRNFGAHQIKMKMNKQNKKLYINTLVGKNRSLRLLLVVDKKRLPLVGNFLNN